MILSDRLTTLPGTVRVGGRGRAINVAGPLPGGLPVPGGYPVPACIRLDCLQYMYIIHKYRK